jgi:hypothetical protein
MFYSHFIYQKNGPLAKIWLASHIMRKMKTADIKTIDITQGAELLINSTNKGGTPFALRLCGQLLIGLVKIWQEKAVLTVEHAEKIMKQLGEMNIAGGDEGKKHKQRGQRKGGYDSEDESKVSVIDSVSNIRAKPNQINLALTNLGSGLGGEDEFTLQGGMEGIEYTENMGAFPEPHMVVNIGDGEDPFGMSLSLTGTGGEGYEELHGKNIEDEPMIEDEYIEGGRANATGDLMPIDDPNTKQLSMLDPSQNGPDDFGFGNNGGGDDFGNLLPPDSKPASVANGVDVDMSDVDEVLQQKQSELRALNLQKKAAVAARKRKHQTWVPQIDDVTEIPSSELSRWISDPSDTLKEPKPATTPVRSAKENVEHLSQITEAEEAPFGAAAAAAGAAAAPSSALALFNLPSTGLGRSAVADLSYLTRLSLQSDAGRFAPRLMRLLQSRMTTAEQLDGFTYHLPEADTSALDDHHSLASRAADPHQHEQDQSLGGLGSFGGEEFDFPQGGGGVEEDPFTQAQATEEKPGKEKSRRGDEEESEEEKEIEGDLFPTEIDPEYADRSSEVDFSLTPSNERQHAIESAVASFWGETAHDEKRRAKDTEESIESGWSKRTKKMHTKLKEKFAGAGAAKAAQSVTLDSMVSGKVRDVAGTAFYQLLVLASGGFIKLAQPQENGEIRIAKTKIFDSKLPVTGTNSGSNASPMDSQQSQLF